MSLPEKRQNIIILGAGHAGCRLAHRLLSLLPPNLYKVYLISPSTHFYFNVVAARVICAPDLLPEESYFLPIAPHFSSYSPFDFELVQGKAIELDPAESMVRVKLLSDEQPEGSGEEMVLRYEQVVVATGSKTAGNWPYKSTLPHAQTVELLQAAREKIAAAQRIVISGAGSTGIETASEIKSQFPDKKVTIITSGWTTIPMYYQSVAKAADQTLKKLGIEIVRNCRLIEERRKIGATEESGEVELKLSNGDVLTADLHIPTSGLFPNTEFLPSSLLDASGWLIVDSYFRSPVAPKVWGLGDATNHWQRKATVAESVVPPMAKNLVAAVKGEKGEEYVYGVDIANFMVLGPKFPNGVGFVKDGWKVPGWLVWLLKGRGYVTWLAPGAVRKP